MQVPFHAHCHKNIVPPFFPSYKYPSIRSSTPLTQLTTRKPDAQFSLSSFSLSHLRFVTMEFESAALFGLLLASILPLLFYFFSFRDGLKSNENNNTIDSKSVDDGAVQIPPLNQGRRAEMSSESDVIVVGAGVAGAALAYTLAKVSSSSSFSKSGGAIRFAFLLF